MRRPVWVAAAVLVLFGVGFLLTLGGAERREPRSVRRREAEPRRGASSADGPGSGPIRSGPPPATASSASGGTPVSPPAAAPGAVPVRAAAEASGAAERRLVRTVVDLRARRDWSGLAALQSRIHALGAREINILLHLLKTDPDVEDQLAVGEILARLADGPGGAERVAGVAPTLARVFRRLVERVDAAEASPKSREQRVRAAEFLCRFARAEDVDLILALFRNEARSDLAQAASLAIGRSGDPGIWRMRLRDAAASADVSLETARLALALDGVGRRVLDPSARDWVRGALGPKLMRLAAGEDRAAALESIATLALLHDRHAAETLADAYARMPDSVGRRRLLALVPDVASPEDVEMLRSRLSLPANDPLASELAAILAELEARSPGR